MSSSTTTHDLEQALSGLPAKLRVHEVAKRAGLTSKDVLAALAAAGVKAASAASSITADDATAVLTTLLAAGEAAPAPEAADQPHAGSDRAPAVPAEPAEPIPQDPGFFAAPLFLPPAEAKPARRRRGTKPAAEPATGDQPALPADTVQAADTVLGVDAADPTGDAADPAGGADADSAAAVETDAESGTSRSGRRRRGRSGGRGRGGQADATDGESAGPGDEHPSDAEPDQATPDDAVPAEADLDDDEDGDQARRRRRRGRRGRGRAGDERSDEQTETAEDGEAPGEPVFDADPATGTAPVEDDTEDESADDEAGDEGGTRRRRRRRRRSGTADPVTQDGKSEDDPDDTVVHVREPRPPRESTSSSASEVQGIRGSTRLEAKRQRRRDSRGDRKRPQILTEAEFLARRESVDRVMAVRQRGDLAQVALLEDGILVEHFVSRAGSESLMGNIYLGKVQNVLPSMEAAFLDIGKGRNAVLYAGEVNWDAAGLGGKARRIETALSGGDTVLVQVSKDPVGQKGARLTTQISLPGRFLVYVPGGGATGISRKLPDTERKRLKSILDRIVPEDAGVIIRTAAEGVAEEELARDVDRLKSQWEQISRQAEKKSNAPLLLSAEPDTLIKVVRDLFNSDISRLVLDGERAYEPVAAYIEKVAPELADRVSRYDGPNDVFAAYRIDEQIAKALERKVYLPSGGSLVIDRTEAMTVVDVNTGKYTGSGGNLEETVTKNNLEAAEEVVRQLRLRDIGGIIVVDFIDMVLESNRELVMRRLTECLGRDRTRHQVAEVTSLGLIQMTRKKMGTGLVEAFSEPCPHCQGRGILLHDGPMEDRSASQDDDANRGRRRGKGRAEPTPEPEPIVKLVPATVRPPDPRGPKPPTRVNGEPAHDSDAVATAPPATPSRAAQDVGSNASFNAPRSRDAADAVSAVLAALDAQSTRRPEPEPFGRAQADAPTFGDDGVTAAWATAATEPVAAEPAPAGRRRGRRAAGRPAGAPSTSSAPAAQADAAAPVDEPAAAVDEPAAAIDEPVEPTGHADGPVGPRESVVDAAVVGNELDSDALAHAASEFAATDLVMAPDVDAQAPVEQPAAQAPVEQPTAMAPVEQPTAMAPVEQPTAAPASRPRRRAGRAAGAAAPSADGTADVPLPPPTATPDAATPDAATPDAATPDAAKSDAGPVDSGTDRDDRAGNAAMPAGDQAGGGQEADGSGSAAPTGAGTSPRATAPRRRRAASRPAGPAGAPVPQ